jgi:amino acid permease
MAKLKDKVQNTLDEARMLVLGAQVLLGFQSRAVFEPGFERLARHAQYFDLGALGLMLVGVALLMTPAAYHQIVEAGEDSKDLERFASNTMTLALIPFALGLGINLFIIVEKLNGTAYGIAAGVFTTAVALFFWWGWELLRRARREPEIMEVKEMARANGDDKEKKTKTKDKIKHVLTEARTILPGAQALLGFQFVTILTEAFEKLPASSKYVHLASLSLVALSIILLMTPAAYHRIVERGELTEHFHRVASRILIAALVPLALGMNGSFYVVFRKTTNSVAYSVAAAALGLLFFYGLWFGFTLYRRGQRADARAQTINLKAV